jgi:hypothetical protein
LRDHAAGIFAIPRRLIVALRQNAVKMTVLQQEGPGMRARR